MKLSKRQKTQLKIFEGLRLKRYNDIGGVATIGYGHTGNNLPNIITKEQADKYLDEDITRFEKHVESYSVKYGYNWNQNEFDALVLFAYNVGSINGVTNSGTRNKKEIASKMLEYCHVNKKPVQGLINRRKYEHDLFLSSVSDDSTNSLKDFDVLFTYVKATYRLRTRPFIEDDNVYNVVTKDTPCKILGKTSDFYFVNVDGKDLFVYKEGVIWK